MAFMCMSVSRVPMAFWGIVVLTHIVTHDDSDPEPCENGLDQV